VVLAVAEDPVDLDGLGLEIQPQVGEFDLALLRLAPTGERGRKEERTPELSPLSRRHRNSSDSLSRRNFDCRRRWA